MEYLETEDKLVTKYIHSDNSETAIKSVSSCDTVRNPVTGEIEINPVDRNKYSVFISSSAGCYMKCQFCYLTIKKMKFSRLDEKQIIANIKEAIVKEAEIHPEIRTKYVKLCWMGMGEILERPEIVVNATAHLIDWILENKYAIGLDGVDLSTVLPQINSVWMSNLTWLNDYLSKFPMNPNNKRVVHSEAMSKMSDYTNRSPLRLFYSLHSANQETRDRIIPRAMPIFDAMRQLRHYSNYNERNVIFHHMFLEGINDSKLELDALVDFLVGWGFSEKNEVRILRYNQCGLSDIRESDKFNECVERLAKVQKNLKVQISAGREVKAACGQFLTPKARFD